MSVYKVIEIIGRSKKSWEDAAASAVETAAKSLDDIRIAEVKELDLKVDNGKVIEYRARLSISFKYDKERMLEDRSSMLKGKPSVL